MRGVLCAGGSGSRLGRWTQRVSNKHTCMVYDRAMIELPIATMVNAGVDRLTIVTSEKSAGDLVRYVGNGAEFGLVEVDYKFQYGASGIADAIRQARTDRKEAVAVMLGDNLFEEEMNGMVNKFVMTQSCKGARVMLKFVPDPDRFGVAKISGETIIDIEEKPQYPKSSLAITGFYLFDEKVFDIIETLKPSGRGEYEVTDILKKYMELGELRYDVTTKFWTDMGTPDSLLLAANWLREKVTNGHTDREHMASVTCLAV